MHHWFTQHVTAHRVLLRMRDHAASLVECKRMKTAPLSPMQIWSAAYTMQSCFVRQACRCIYNHDNRKPDR